jgi:hypothetical protein
MTPEELDSILSSDETLEPSPGFAQSVMASVRRETGGLAPLRFPWWRFAAGVAGAGGMALGATMLLGSPDTFTAPVPGAVLAIVYALVMLLVSLAVAAVPHVLSKP